MTSRPRPSTTPRPRALGLGAGPAVAGWLAVLVTMTATVHPVVSGGAFLGLTALAMVLGRFRLVLMSLLVGAGLLLVVPGVALTSGSWSFTFGPTSAWLPEPTPSGVLLALASVLRIPAQVLAIVLLLAVPLPRLLGKLATLSPHSSLLAAIAARMRQLLAADASEVRDELRSRGVPLHRGASLASRIRAAGMLWESLVAGAFDRAFATATVLHERGWGSQQPTTDALVDPRVASGQRISTALDASVVAVSALLVVATIFGRVSGILAPPVIQVFSGVTEPVTAPALSVAVIAAAIGVLPAIVIHRAGRLPMAPPSIEHDVHHGRRPAEAMTAIGPTTTSVPLVVVRDVTIRRRDAHLASIPKLDLHVGELVVLGGASGSGKSTLLDVLTGIAGDDASLEVSGSISGSATTLALVVQDPARQVVFDVVAEDVALAPRAAGCSVRQIEDAVVDALDQLRVLHLARRRCSTLSGGELQRVMIAAAVARRPEVLLLDEPFAQLDDAGRASAIAAIEALRIGHGTAVLIADHPGRGSYGAGARHISLRDGVVTDGEQDLSVVEDALVQPSGHVLRPNVSTRQRNASVRQPILPVRQLIFPAGVSISRCSVELPGASAGTLVVRDLDVPLAAGMVVAVTGSNGAGKTTLLRALRGLDPPVVGGMLVGGVPTTMLAATTSRVGWVAQHAGTLVLASTLRDHVGWTLPVGPLGDALLQRALCEAGITAPLDQHPAALSVGQRQRCAIVAATLHRPLVWILDEPSRGMDAAARQWLLWSLARHQAAGGIVIFASHDAALIESAATHRLALGDGIGFIRQLGRRPAPTGGAGVSA